MGARVVGMQTTPGDRGARQMMLLLLLLGLVLMLHGLLQVTVQMGLLR